MMKSERFAPIQVIAARAADELRRAMADAERRVAELERQLQQLQTYRDEYIRKGAGTGASMDAVRLQNYRAFLGRLGEVIGQHLQKLGVARGDYESRRTLWSEKRLEAESLARAVERFRSEERAVAERREQRESDEAAMRMGVAAAGAPSDH
jgi:flagellar FliJ protein